MSITLESVLYQYSGINFALEVEIHYYGSPSIACFWKNSFSLIFLLFSLPTQLILSTKRFLEKWKFSFLPCKQRHASIVLIHPSYCKLYLSEGHLVSRQAKTYSTLHWSINYHHCSWDLDGLIKAKSFQPFNASLWKSQAKGMNY